MKRALSILIVGFALITTACDGVDDATFAVQNESSFLIEEIRLAPIGEPFGPDLLGPDVLLPGERLEVVAIPCDIYDVLLVDELGAECTLSSVELCFVDAIWVIDDATLAECPIFGAFVPPSAG